MAGGGGGRGRCTKKKKNRTVGYRGKRKEDGGTGYKGIAGYWWEVVRTSMVHNVVSSLKRCEDTQRNKCV